MRVSVKWAWAGLGVALALAAGVFPWPVPPARVSTEMNFALGAIDVSPFRLPASATLRLLPRPTLNVADVRIVAMGAGLQARAATAEIGLRPDRLLLGQFAPTDVALANATLAVDLDAISAIAGRALAPPFARLTMQDGLVKVTSASRGWDATVEIGDAAINWPRATSPLTFSGTGRWRGQPVVVGGRLASPQSALEGLPSGAEFTLASPPVDLRFSGDWSPNEELEGRRSYDGDFSARIRSIDEIRHWLSPNSPPLLSLRDVQLQGHAAGDSDAFGIGDAKLQIGDQTLEGALALSRPDGRIAASGTFAADTLDLAALLGDPPPLREPSGAWSRRPILPHISDKLDLDLRVSAGLAVWGSQKIENAAVAITHRQEHFSIKLIEATAGHGALSGEISVARILGECETTAWLTLDNADVGDLLRQWGILAYSGRGGLKGSVHAKGDSAAEIVASATGEATLDLENGSISGINFEEALRRSLRRPLDLARDMTSGQTRFDSAHAQLAIADGAAKITQARAQGPGTVLEMTGEIAVADRAWRTHILALQSGQNGAPTPDGAHLALALSGSWDAPIFWPTGGAY